MPLYKEIKRKLNDLTDNEKLLVLNYLIKELDKPDPEIDKEFRRAILPLFPYGIFYKIKDGVIEI